MSSSKQSNSDKARGYKILLETGERLKKLNLPDELKTMLRELSDFAAHDELDLEGIDKLTQFLQDQEREYASSRETKK